MFDAECLEEKKAGGLGGAVEGTSGGGDDGCQRGD